MSSDVGSALRYQETTSTSTDAMNQLLQRWGLEALSERFAEHLIDMSVLDYIVDVDIVDLCRDLPIRYRIVLRHNLQNGYHKEMIIADQSNKRPHTIISFAKDPEALNPDSPGRKRKRKRKSLTDPTASDTLGSDVEPTNFVSVETPNNANSSGTESGQENMSIRSILIKEPKFRPILSYLDKGSVPDATGLRFMNRLVVNHFFEERILEESSYPKKHEKQALALKILEAYPQLERTRITPDAPKESFFFWKNGGKEKGPHTGLIETRTANMRKEVPPEHRRYQRKERGPINYILPDSIREHASKVARLSPLPPNEQTITNAMSECIDLHSCILQQGDSEQTETLISTFPHLLSYDGKMVQQAFKLLHTYYDASSRTDRFLLLGLLLDSKTFNNIENKYIRGTLRIMKKLIMIGKKEDGEEMSTDEAEASPLIRWIKRKEGEQEAQAVQRHVKERSYLAPHIVCVADVFKAGNMFVVFQGKYIACGKSAAQSLDVFFKMFAVFGVAVPVLLRKIHELLMVYLWKVTATCKTATVTKVMTRLKELEAANDEDDYEDEDELS